MGPSSPVFLAGSMVGLALVGLASLKKIPPLELGGGLVLPKDVAWLRHFSSSSLSLAFLQKPSPKRAGAAD